MLPALVASGALSHANAIFSQTAACAQNQSICAINDADLNTFAPGVTTSDLVISADGLFIANDGNNNLTITLLGFQHPEAGDLIVQLTNLSRGITRDLFYRMGAVNPSDPNDPGFLANFGGNYDFNGSYPTDLWNQAAGLGDADTIPDTLQGSLYFPLTVGHVPSDLSTAFNGLALSGTWELTIIDMVPGPDDPFVTPQFTGWTLSANVAPEPSYAVIVGMAIAAGWWFRRRRG